jgi:hypothetical protein
MINKQSYQLTTGITCATYYADFYFPHVKYN